MLEVLQRRGEAAVARRAGRQRLWDLAERVYPADRPEFEDEEARVLLGERRLRAQGVAKPHRWWNGVEKDSGEPAEIEGVAGRWRVDPEALAALDDDPGGRVAFLNPYDPLLFERRRLEDLFDFTYVLEQFKPKAQRRYGYFAHPILFGDRFIGMLEAEVEREEGRLKVAAVHEFQPFDPEEDELVRLEIEELARWLGVRVDAW